MYIRLSNALRSPHSIKRTLSTFQYRYCVDVVVKVLIRLGELYATGTRFKLELGFPGVFWCMTIMKIHWRQESQRCLPSGYEDTILEIKEEH